MITCIKRQKNVNRAKSTVTFHCLNRQCGVFGQEVSDDVCSRCTGSVERHQKPCKKSPPSLTVDTMTNEEVEALVADSPIGMADLEAITTPDGEVPDYPKMSLQLWLYKEAVLKWNKKGRPVRSDEEIEEIHTKYCKPCTWYDNGRCKGCGCKVSVGSIAVFNKIKMKTEHCPQEKW